MADLVAEIRQNCRHEPVQLARRAEHELHFALRDGEDLPRVAGRLAQLDCEPLLFLASDERTLEAGTYKVHLIVSAADGHIVFLEQGLTVPGRPTEYYSPREAFPCVLRWEQEIAELFGLVPCNLPLPMTARKLLEGPYAPGFHPLDRSKTMAELQGELVRGPGAESPRSTSLSAGLLMVEAGPIHAGIKEAAAIEITVAGETIEKLEVYPGRKHRGVEKTFETVPLEDGWRLAEVADGQTGVAHALAYSMAVESIAGVEAPPLAQSWRAALLELERIANHIGTCATLIHDIKLPIVSSPMFTLREQLRDLNARLTGNRWLQGVVRPGGVVLEPRVAPDRLVAELDGLVANFLALAISVMESPSCRDRLIGAGALTAEEARRCGAPGLVRRTTGAMEYDWRLRHAFGAYQRADIREEILNTVTDERARPRAKGAPVARMTGLQTSDLTGDDFARLALRAAEVETSLHIIRRLAPDLVGATPRRPGLAPIGDNLAAADAFEVGFGCVEGARGGIGICAMRGPGKWPLRCKNAGPSEGLLRSFGIAASARSPDERGKLVRGDILADVPLTNVAINGSPVECAG